MTSRKFSLIVVTFIVTLLCSTFVLAKDDNTINNAGAAISNVTRDAGESMKNDAKNAGSTIKNGIENIGNTVKNGAGNIGNAMENGLDRVTSAINGDNDNNNNDNNATSSYMATRTNTQYGTFFGMGPIAWTWFALALAGIIIIALVWHYGTQTSRYNDND